MKINRNFFALQNDYLFAEVGARVAAYRAEHPDERIISLGLGDVTQPLGAGIVRAMHRAADEMGNADTFRGYGPYVGYPFLRNAIAAHYGRYGVSVDPDEVFVSDGAKSDIAGLSDLFSSDGTVLLPDPVYPAYRDCNLLDGRTIVYAAGSAENGFLPAPPTVRADLVCLCSPNNPCGTAYTREGLRQWVDYANACDAVLLFDAAYACFVTDPDVPHSVYETAGASRCAIEICSFSKSAGFTGLRCGYSIIPRALKRDGAVLADLWKRRQSTKFNGVSYITQRAAEAVFSAEGLLETERSLSVYRKNALALRNCFETLGIPCFGGIDSPYVFARCCEYPTSRACFEALLHRCGIVVTPGSGFGPSGEGYVRLSAFATPEDVDLAIGRLTEFFSE